MTKNDLLNLASPMLFRVGGTLNGKLKEQPCLNYLSDETQKELLLWAYNIYWSGYNAASQKAQHAVYDIRFEANQIVTTSFDDIEFTASE